MTVREPAAAEVDFWQRYRAGWHVLAGATVVLVGGFVLADARTAGQRTVILALLVLLAAWYAVVGAPVLACSGEHRALLYFAGAVVILAYPYAVTMTIAFLLFLINPQIFAMIDAWRYRWIALTLVYGEIAVFTVYHNGFTPHALVPLAINVVIPSFFAILIGLWISGIIHQSRARGALIEELRRTREELAVERHEAGVHAERERLAADIHDTLAQGFTSILMLTQAARVGGQVDEQLDLIERTARENLAEARALVAALTPPDLAGGGLAEAIRRLAERHTRDTGVPVVVEGSGGPSAPSTDVMLLRAAQEALANIRRHAQASKIHIELSGRAVTVTDDGRGFDPNAVTEGYGLPGLRGRASAFGGTCTIESAPGAGTTVAVRLP